MKEMSGDCLRILDAVFFRTLDTAFSYVGYGFGYVGYGLRTLDTAFAYVIQILRTYTSLVFTWLVLIIAILSW